MSRAAAALAVEAPEEVLSRTTIIDIAIAVALRTHEAERRSAVVSTQTNVGSLRN
jgi:hypothetical protein